MLSDMESKMPSESENTAASRRALVLLVVGGVLVLVLAVGGYLFFKYKDSASARSAASKSSKQVSAAGLDRLAKVRFLAPANLAGYKMHTATAPGASVYVTNDGECELDFGTTTPALLPGDDIGGIVAGLLDTYRKNGAIISGPTAGDALVLQDAKKAKYSLPTLVFTMRKLGTQIVSHYSLSILKDGTRAYVTRVCTKKDADVDPVSVEKVDATAKLITVKD